MAVDLQASRDSRDTHPSLGLSSTSQELSVEDCQPPGLWAAHWGGSVAGSSGQPAKQQEAQLGETALGAGPGRRERGSWDGSSAWPLARHPRAPAHVEAWLPWVWERGTVSWAGQGEPACHRFPQEVPQAQLSCPGSASADVVSKGEARNPRLPCFATLWALFRTGWGACYSLASPPPPPPAFPAQSQGVHHLWVIV